MGSLTRPSGGIRILTDDIEEHPILDFDKYSSTISRIIGGSEPNFAIGIYGDWGIGKTSLMRLIERQLNKETILTVWFNAWKYEREDRFALIALMRTIAYAMGKHPIYRKISPVMKDGLLSVAKGVGKHVTSHVLGEETLAELKDVGPKKKFLSNIEKDGVYFDGVQRIEDEMKNILKKYPSTKVVIFIDDLDRCSPRTTVDIFESIKVFLGIEGFVYVLGLNHRTIIKLIQKAYEGTDIDGERYLRKIIQVPITIPEWSVKDIELLIENLIEKVDSNYSDIIAENKDIIATAVELNPREVKRFINNFILASELFGGSRDRRTKVNHKELLVIQALKLRRPVFFHFFSQIPFSDSASLSGPIVQDLNTREEILNMCGQTSLERSTRIETLNEKQDITNKEAITVLASFASDSELWKFLAQNKSIVFGIRNFESYRRVADVVDNDEGSAYPYGRSLKVELRRRRDLIESKMEGLEKQLEKAGDPKVQSQLEETLARMQLEKERIENRLRYLSYQST